MTALRALAAAFAVVVAGGGHAAAEPKSCSQAHEVCIIRSCDSGCMATCRQRFIGCMKTGAFSISKPRVLLQNLKRN